MGDSTSISWTDATWNPIRGCSRVSEGCRHCYAERVAARFSDEGQPYHGLARRVLKTAGASQSRWTGEVRLIPEHLADPLRWKRPRRIFVNSMSDLFHERLTNEQIAAVFGVMTAAPQHTFQVLTKRARRMCEWFGWLEAQAGCVAGRLAFVLGEAVKMLPDVPRASRGEQHGPQSTTWPLPNVWLGVSVENQDAADERIPELLATPAAVRFLSCEPLIGPVDLSQWLGANDVEQDQDGRAVRVSSGDRVRVVDRRQGPDLANCEPPRNEGWRDDLHPMQGQAGRSIGREGLSEYQGDGRREADDRAVASPGVVALQGSDTGRPHGQSQERREVRQPAGELGACDGRGAADSREPGTGHRTGREPDGGAQSVRQGDDGAGRGDPSSARDGRDLRGDRGALRDHVSAGLANRARSQSLHWIIVGCESGPGARPCSVEWLRSLRDQCAAAGVPYFLKQATEDNRAGRFGSEGPVSIGVGHTSKRKGGGVIELPYLDGVQHCSFPEVAK